MIGNNVEKTMKEMLEGRFEKVKWKKANEEIVPLLLKFEASNIISNYKVGILFLKEGQSENEAFSNRINDSFLIFLNLFLISQKRKLWRV